MNNPRNYGDKPFKVVLLHGGPGAGGEMVPVARELAKKCGVLEPIQTEHSVGGQIAELKRQLTDSTQPVILVGYSWGAWLATLFAAKYPVQVKKLILVSSGPFEQSYADKIEQTRRSRLSQAEADELSKLLKGLNDQGDVALARIGEITMRVDSYNPDIKPTDAIELDMSIFSSVWPQASELRKSGELLQAAAKIKCPVIAIHGDYDPHPYGGVKTPLEKVISDFKFVLLNKCGHHPWLEREAKDSFFAALDEELR